MERLAREKIALQQKFATLKKELAAQWDHIDFNKLVPDMMVVESAAPGAHSTANQGWWRLALALAVGGSRP